MNPMLPDGITDGSNTFRGVRSYDSALGAWTTPDAYAGEVGDPLSQKAYMWNRNNPSTYSDPSGFTTAEDRRAVGGPSEEIPTLGDSNDASSYQSTQDAIADSMTLLNGQMGSNGYFINASAAAINFSINNEADSIKNKTEYGAALWESASGFGYGATQIGTSGHVIVPPFARQKDTVSSVPFIPMRSVLLFRANF